MLSKSFSGLKPDRKDEKTPGKPERHIMQDSLAPNLETHEPNQHIFGDNTVLVGIPSF